MVLSLLGYFFYLVAVFTTVMVLLVRLSDVTTLQKVRHYQRPTIFQETSIAAKAKHRHPSVALARKDQSPEPVSTQDGRNSGPIVVAKIIPEKNKRTRRARLDGLMLFARQGENHNERRDRIALGYADVSGYRAGLDAQR